MLISGGISARCPTYACVAICMLDAPECKDAHSKFQVSKLNRRRDFCVLISLFSVFRPAWSSFHVLEVLILSQRDQETFNASSH